MPTVRLTQSVVDGLSAGTAAKVAYYDLALPNFGVYVLKDSPSRRGARTYFIRYVDEGGRQRIRRVADARHLELAKARDAAKVLLGRAASGVDLQAERNAKRKAAAERQERTLQWVVDRYRESPARNAKRPRTLTTEDERLDSLVLPSFGSIPAAEISASDVETLMEKVWRERTPLRAGHARDALRTVLEYAVRKGWVAFNAAKVVKPDPQTKAGSRSRELSDREIAAIWNAGGRSVLHDALRLALLCATRAGETVSAEWSEFDLENAVWVIPAEHTKKNRNHRVYLSAEAVLMLRRLRQRAEDKAKKHDEETVPPWLFPNRKGTGACTPDKVTHACHRIAADLSPPPSEMFSPHDFRRTAVTRLAASGLTNAEPVLAALLSHISLGGSKSLPVYLRYTWEKELRLALETWSCEVVRIAANAGAQMPTEPKISV